MEAAMKKTALIGMATAALIALPAAAADLARGYGAPAPYSAFSWAGPYLGANLGYQWGSSSNNGADPSGLTGGIQVGYNWQTGQFVYGVETDFNFSGADDAFAGRTFSNPWFGTVRARVGVAMNNVLFYGTGGLAYGGGRVEAFGLTESHAHFGWTLGVGAEVGLTPNWSAKVEYLFIDLRDERYVLTGLDHDFESSLLRFGFNYRF
jgi:outer membrane immunogenic protein